jgi:uncharacterized membrane protein YhaH (DUF805 family)
LFYKITGYLAKKATVPILLLIPEFYPIQSLFTYLLMSPLLIPLLAAAARRLHDVGKSGWNLLWFLTVLGGIAVLIWLVKIGSTEENQYGPPIVLEPVR